MKLTKFLTKQKFRPSLIGIFFNPYYIIRMRLLKGILLHKDEISGKVLDFGCGDKPYEDIFSANEYIGIDISESGHDNTNKSADIYYDGSKIPFGDNSFDSIFSSEVFEHIFNIDDILEELNRVLKQDGKMLITLPFVWFEHEIPYDYARYTSFGINHLLKKHGFEIISETKSSTYIETLSQMLIAYIYQTLIPSNISIKMILVPFLISPLTIISLIISKIAPAKKNFYLNNIILAKKS